MTLLESSPVTDRAPTPQRRQQPDERPNHLRVVAPAERMRRRLTPAAAVVLTAIVFTVLLTVAVAHTVLVSGQVRLDELDAQLSSEQARYQELRKDVAELEAPTRIVGAAHELGMVTPDDLLYLQPPAADRPTVGPTTGDAPEPGAVPTGEVPDQTWAAMKSMLGATGR